MRTLPCGVSSAGATPHSGHGCAEYSFSRAGSQVGARTPWRLIITTYLSRGAPVTGHATPSAQSTITTSRLLLTIETIPQTARVIGLVKLALVHEDRASGVVTEHFVCDIQGGEHRGEPVA